jgi:hypothetical protein
MPDVGVQDPALEFFYFGFYRALRRFRTMAIAGWCVVAAGSAGCALRWETVWRGDLITGALCALLAAAGILLVQQSVSELSAYVRIPFPRPSGTTGVEGERAVIGELERLLEDVESGGWREAVWALAELRTLGARYGLPGPDGTPFQSGDQQTGSFHNEDSR